MNEQNAVEEVPVTERRYKAWTTHSLERRRTRLFKRREELESLLDECRNEICDIAHELLYYRDDYLPR